ncbi:CRISPR-associated ring nuclease Csm6 [Conservatibacter flavescens]|uniref:CRISPR-associated ring nuclease Csm6 n=1 Tax=Conservatibacter flavescens TaxID=28161 RepID=UPI001FAECA2D|nr:CRISPR-associated ring nuclease Csm6 [Conservatibacter flavescens]
MNTYHQYNKRILLSVTGMSPAVVTETLYALVTEKGFIPTEIRVITTLQGKRKLLEGLLGITGGRKEKEGALAEFIADYGKQYGIEHIHFDESCISIIQDKEGNELEDIRSPEENMYSSDQIVSLVGKLCQDKQTALHVSIAGGRKTMGFFLGYALSLYGREQDSLSHVLVESEYETLPHFFYPKPHRYLINDREGKELDISQAKVMLAEIPWVRLGLGVSEDLLHNRITYSGSIYNAQQILVSPSLTFLDPIDDRTVLFGEKKIKLAPKEYALLLSLAIAKSKNIDCGYYDETYLKIYLKIYALLKADSSVMTKNLGFIQDKFSLEHSDGKRVLSESANKLKDKIIVAFH